MKLKTNQVKNKEKSLPHTYIWEYKQRDAPEDSKIFIKPGGIDGRSFFGYETRRKLFQSEGATMSSAGMDSNVLLNGASHDKIFFFEELASKMHDHWYGSKGGPHYITQKGVNEVTNKLEFSKTNSGIAEFEEKYKIEREYHTLNVSWKGGNASDIKKYDDEETIREYMPKGATLEMMISGYVEVMGIKENDEKFNTIKTRDEKYSSKAVYLSPQRMTAEIKLNVPENTPVDLEKFKSGLIKEFGSKFEEIFDKGECYTLSTKKEYVK